jgi:hypothetical protein
MGAAVMYFLDADRQGPPPRPGARSTPCTARVGVVTRPARQPAISERSYGVVAQLRSGFSGDVPSDHVLGACPVSTREDRRASACARRLSQRRRGRAARTCFAIRSHGTAQGCGERARGTRCRLRTEEHTHTSKRPCSHGGERRPGLRADILQAQWSPTTRLLVTAAGLALIAYCIPRRD